MPVFVRKIILVIVAMASGDSLSILRLVYELITIRSSYR